MGSSREKSLVKILVWAEKRKVGCAGGRFEVLTRRPVMWARAVKCDRVRIGMVKDHDPVCGANGKVKEEVERRTGGKVDYQPKGNTVWG